MSSSTGSGGVVNDRAAGTAEKVVEADRGGDGQQPTGDPGAEAVQGAGAVSFEGEDVFEGFEDALDALTDRREVWSLSGLVFAARSDHGRVQPRGGGLELSAGVALVGDDRERSDAVDALEHPQTNVPLVLFRAGQKHHSRGAVQHAEGVQTKPVEQSGVAGAIPVVGRVSESVVEAGAPAAFDRFLGTGALHRRGVGQQHVVFPAGAVAREDAGQPLDRVGELVATLVVARALGQVREQVPQLLDRGPNEPVVARDTHDLLSDRERYDLRVGQTSAVVEGLLGQEIVSYAEHVDQQQVEVGEHRGSSLGSAVMERTADFDQLPYDSFDPTTQPQVVELLI